MNKTLISILLLMISGCAIHYTDKKGKDNYLGFVSISTENNHCIVTNTAKSFGLTIDTTKESGGVNIGFRKTSKSYISENSLVEFEEVNTEHTYPTNITSNCNGREKDAPLN